MKMFVSCILMVVLVLLSSCKRYLKIEFNQYSRVYLPGLVNVEGEDCFDLYRSETNPTFRAGKRIYFFDTVKFDWLGKVSPALAYVEKGSREVIYVCQNPACVHNNPENFTERCILCDISDCRYVACQDGMLYFARAKRENGEGGIYYNQTDGTDRSEEEAEAFLEESKFAAATEVEVPWEIIAYDLEAETYEILYSVPAESYLDSVVYLNGSLYFVETYYAERKNLILEEEDGEWYYFYNTLTDRRDIKRKKRHFYTELTLREEVMQYYQIDLSEEPASLWRHLVNLRDNRKYKLGEEKQLFERVYALKKLDLNTREVITEIPELSSEPQELLACETELYLADKEGIRLISEDLTEQYMLCDYADLGMDYTAVSSLQYDEYTGRLYFLAGGRVYGLVIYQDRGEVFLLESFSGGVRSYQLTADGIYFIVGKFVSEEFDVNGNSVIENVNYGGSLCFVRWNELSKNKHTVIYDADEQGVPVVSATVIGDSVYIALSADEKEKYYYSFYRFRMVTTVTDYVSVEDPDTPGAGILDYEINIVSTKLTNTRVSLGNPDIFYGTDGSAAQKGRKI